jgi:hypothetical protein
MNCPRLAITEFGSSDPNSPNNSMIIASRAFNNSAT